MRQKKDIYINGTAGNKLFLDNIFCEELICGMESIDHNI